MKSKRINVIDTGRGLMMLLVMWFHLSYDLYYIYGMGALYMQEHWVYVFRDCFVGVLILISGISCNLTRSNLKRGLKTFLIGMAITVGTGIFMPTEFIVFGILHFFGASMMIYALMEKALPENRNKTLSVIGIILSILLFAITYYYVFIVRVSAPEGSTLTKVPLNYLFYVLGIRTGVQSADYYPIIPWIFLFFTGAFMGRGLKEDKEILPEFMYKDYCPPVSFIGRHTLIIYLVHQPVFMGILWLITKVKGA